ncbi:MAG: hypothetical protein IPH18_10740 [Chitinophagaceae bacterium]|nr:hypothetical protein [Chitinophagaceae bacterium]
MKKRLLSAALIAAVLFTTSCGSSSSFESDVRKKANYMCEIQKLEAKAATDEKAAKEMESIKKEMDAFDEKMEKNTIKKSLQKLNRKKPGKLWKK